MSEPNSDEIISAEIRKAILNRPFDKELDKEKIAVQGLQDDIDLKKKYANWFLGILICQLVVMNMVFVAVGFDWLKYNEPAYLNIYMGGTLTEIFGTILVITKYLFSKK